MPRGDFSLIHKNAIIKNVLFKEIAAIRVDSMWRMLALAKDGYMPGKTQEGATGIFDNKGAIFVPGGLVFDDSDRKPIEKTHRSVLNQDNFRRKIRDAMQNDNATLLFSDGLAVGINLDNGFFANIASNILANKQAAMKRRPFLNATPSARLYSEDITRSNSPAYMATPYGARTKLSSCLAVCLMEPRMYYVACLKEFGLRDEKEEQHVWNNIRIAKKQITGEDGSVLAPPYVVVCHTTRYQERNIVGIVRILGIGKFGEFANFTLEKLSGNLLSELNIEEDQFDRSSLFAQYKETSVVGVLRFYAPTRPGKRSQKFVTTMVHPKDDLDIDLEKISAEAKKRYNIE